MIDKGFGGVGREGVQGGKRSGFARLAAVAVVGIVGLGLTGGLSACSSDPATKPAAMSTPVTPTVTVTSTRPVAPATSSSSAPATTATTRTSATSTATATRAGAAPVVQTHPAGSSLDPALVGTWEVHGSIVKIFADGTGTVSNSGYQPAADPVAGLMSQVRVTPFGASGARLTVVRTMVEDTSGHVVPVPAGVDVHGSDQAVGDYSVLQPFTAATWPYPAPLSTEVQRDVYSWLSAGQGQPLGNPKDQSARIIRTTGNPARPTNFTYFGA